MIYRLTYCNKDGVEARVDIQKGLATPVIEVEGTERPFILSYNNDKGNKSGMFLSSSADIEIYETSDLDLDLNFNIDNLKTSNETELSVTHYINNVISWQGFIIPDFFSIEVRNNPVITMTASDRLGTLKNVTLSDLPSMISLRELAILCLDKTGLSLPLRTMADFNNGAGVNDFFNSKILTQRLSDTKGRSISCYDILSSILTASNSFLVQRSGGWHIINKIQHEAGSGKLYTGATSFINWSDVIFNFSDISTGGRRTIIPVASTVGVFHEFGGGRLHPENYDFLHDLTGWTPVGGFVATIDNRSVDTFTTGGSGGAIISPVYGDATEKKYLVNNNEYVRNVNPIYLESDPIPIFYKGPGAVNISLDINAVGPSASSAYIRVAIIATNGTDTKILDYSGNFIDYPDVNPPVFTTQFNDELAIAPTILKALSKGLAVSGKLEVEDDLSLYSLKIRLYGGGGGRYVLINSASVIVKSGANDNAKGIIYKVEREDNYTKAHEINTSLFADYLTTGLNGYFYDYSIDDTSSLYNSANELTSKWTAYNDPEQLPLLQHITRQRSRLFSVAHDLLSAEIEVNNFDPLAIFVACNKRYTVVSAQFDFFKSNLSVELEEVAFQNANVRDFIYSYFGDGESGIKSVGGISGGGGGGGTGGGLTPEQLEILSWWKKDPDNPDTIFTEMNAYSTKELSAYGVGDGGGGGGSDYERLDTWASYDSSKAEWVLSAFLGNDLNTRVTAIDGRVTDLENSAGGGGSGSVTSVGISVPTGLSVSNSPITSSGVIAIGLQAGYSIPTTEKQGQWDTAYSNTHTHANKTQLDLITQSNIDVLAKLSIVNGNLQIDGNAYATGELSAHGAGDGGGSGGGIIENVYGYGNLGQTFNNNILTDTFNAYTINQINTRLVSVESGSATTVNTTGTGNAITSISKVGSVITANKGLTFSLSGHTHPISDITNLQTALNSKLETSIFNTHNDDNVRHITGAERTKWDDSFNRGDFREFGLGANYNILDLDDQKHNSIGYTAAITANRTIPYGGVFRFGSGSSYVQLYGEYQSKQDLHFRRNRNGVFDDWRKLWHDGNLTSLSQLTDNIGVATHIANKENPHLVTTAQIGAVDLTTNQSIGGVKSFTDDSFFRKNIILGQSLNSYIHFSEISGGDGFSLLYDGAGAGDNNFLHITGGIGSVNNQTKHLTIRRNSGNVGIGTVNPQYKLDVLGTGRFTGNLTAPKVIFNSAGWSMEQVGNELQLKYNNLIASRFLADGSIVGLGEITAYGATTGGEGVSLLRTGGTMTGNLTMSADIIMNSGRAIGKSNLPLKLLGNALTYNASNVLTEANTATQIKMGNGWTIEQTTASLTIRKNGVIKGTFNA